MNKKRIIVKVDPELYKELKIVCIEKNTTQTNFVTHAILEYMKSQNQMDFRSDMRNMYSSR